MEEEQGDRCAKNGGGVGDFPPSKEAGFIKNWNIAGKLCVGAIGGSKEKSPSFSSIRRLHIHGFVPVWEKNVVFSNLCIFFFFCVWESVGCRLAGVLWDFPLLTPSRLQSGCYCFSSSFFCLKIICKSSFSHLKTKTGKAIIFRPFFSYFFWSKI